MRQVVDRVGIEPLFRMLNPEPHANRTRPMKYKVALGIGLGSDSQGPLRVRANTT